MTSQSKSGDLLVIASARAKPGHEHDLERALREVAAPTRAQPGSVAFSLYRAVNDSALMVGHERWASTDAHDRHLQGAHVQRLMAAMANILAEPPQIVAYEIVDE